MKGRPPKRHQKWRRIQERVATIGLRKSPQDAFVKLETARGGLTNEQLKALAELLDALKP